MVKGLLDKAFVLGVEGTGGLVEKEYIRMTDDGAGDAEPLALPPTEAVATVADVGVVALGLLQDELMGVGHLGCLLHLGLGGVGKAEGNVAPDGVVEEDGVLCHHTDMLPEVGDAERGKGLSIHEDLAAGAVVETHKEVEQGGLAGAGAAYQSHGAALGNG